MMTEGEINQALLRDAFGSIGRTYRGSIIENAKRFRLSGPAYDSMPPEQDGYFDINSALQCAGPLEALQDDSVREVGIIGATQIFKTICGNVWLPYVMEHDPADALVVFESEDKALSFANRRLMTTIKTHPTLSARIEQETGSRHDITKTKIVSNSMSLTVGALNDTTVSTFSYRYIWVSESWQHHDDGMLNKAIRRADRFPDTCKILIESQAGIANGDLHNWAKTAHTVPLTWECPYCSGRQTWEFTQVRPDDFKALEPKVIPEGWTAPVAGTHCGMWFEGAELTKEDGTKRERTIAERARTAKWECYHCGIKIPDRPSIRQAIAKTYKQDYRIEIKQGVFVSPRAVCFYLPKESNTGNTFEKSVASYLSAKNAEKFGNKQPLIDWYISERAIFYAEGGSNAAKMISTGGYSPSLDIPGLVRIVMGVDAQQDDAATAVAGSPKTGHFWYVVRAIDESGNMFQLDRGYATSWAELISVQDKWKVRNDDMGIDCSFYRNDIIQMAVNKIREYPIKHRKHGKVREELWGFTWTLLAGDTTGRNSWKWKDGRFRAESEMVPEFRLGTFKGQQMQIKVPIFNWSQLTIKDQLAAFMAGGLNIKFHSLGRDQISEATRLKEVGNFTYENQLAAAFRTINKKGKPFWDANGEPHYHDAECMCLVLLDLAGHLGVPAPSEADPT